MTSTQSSEEILKTDSLARMRTPAARKQELLEEFDRSGLSGVKFAALVGIKYSTFAGWMARRRGLRQTGPPVTGAMEGASKVRWLEAVLDQAQGQADQNASGLIVRLSGGARLEIGDFHQIELAAALLRALAKPSASC
jgi:hypothetical protein